MLQHQSATTCGQSLFKCRMCQKDFANKPALLQHIADAHPKGSGGAAAGGGAVRGVDFKCRTCGQDFGSKAVLLQHLEDAHPKISGRAIAGGGNVARSLYRYSPHEASLLVGSVKPDFLGYAKAVRKQNIQGNIFASASSKDLDALLKQLGVDVASHRIELKAAIALWKSDPAKALVKLDEAKLHKAEGDRIKAERKAEQERIIQANAYAEAQAERERLAALVPRYCQFCNGTGFSKKTWQQCIRSGNDFGYLCSQCQFPEGENYGKVVPRF